MSELSIASRVAWSVAARDAAALGSADIDREHLFVALCKADFIASISDAEGLTADQCRDARAEASLFVRAVGDGGLDAVKARRRTRELWLADRPERQSFSGHRTDACRAVFAAAEAAEPSTITLASLLRALLKDPGPTVERVLGEQQIDKGLLAETLNIVSPAPRPQASSVSWGRDLSALARDGKLRPATGREVETKQVARILLQSGKSSPLLVGEAGVGKTAIVEGFACRLATSTVPAPLANLRIVEISLGALVAGTKYRGEFEDRVQRVLKDAETDPNLVLFIDEIHMLLGAGAASGSLDAANLLKPALARGTLRCIGATTTAEYRKYIESDAALTRRFQVVRVEEPTPDQAIAILRGMKPSLEEHYNVTIADSAITVAVDLSIRHLPALRLPDKAIDLMNQACSRVAFATFSAPADDAVKPVTDEAVVYAVAERCNIPVEQLNQQGAAALLDMEDALRARVVGQPAAIAAVARTIRTARAGLRQRRRPMGVFLLLGPTGTGKTELARATAEYLYGSERDMIRLDMSEFAEKHQVARLVGAPPGYVGHDSGGQLTEAIRSKPFSVVLFDEVDKAHPDVHGLFLQIFDEGTLTDGSGKTASFRDAVIFMTANFAAPAPAQEPIGFMQRAESDAAAGEGGPEDARRLFRREILNRIDHIVTFAPLTLEALALVTDKIVRLANDGLAERGIVIELSSEARAFITSRGYSTEYGARALEREFRRVVEEPLGRLILENMVGRGDRVYVEMVDGAPRVRPPRLT